MPWTIMNHFSNNSLRFTNFVTDGVKYTFYASMKAHNQSLSPNKKVLNF